MTKFDAIIGLIVMVVLIAVIAIDPHNWEPCPTEDSSHCYWDGGSNGEGKRFVSLSDDIIIYLP